VVKFQARSGHKRQAEQVTRRHGGRQAGRQKRLQQRPTHGRQAAGAPQQAPGSI